MTVTHNFKKSSNIRDRISCVTLHHSPQYAEAAAHVIGDQWNHKEGEIQRNIKSMVEDSRDNLPCHLAILLKLPNSDGDGENDPVVVGHVKLVRASGKGDGSSCISFSLVVAEQFRGLGLGRVLTEEAENYVRSLNVAYMYLSTDDKVPFYEHLGYKQCEPISSLGNNSKRLNSMQLSALEGLFAKRANVDSSTGNTWLRKRLIQENPLSDLMEFSTFTKMIGTSLVTLIESSESYNAEVVDNYVGYVNRMRWQQQTGPSCGISALNMVSCFLEGKNLNQSNEVTNSFCNCIGEMKKVDPGTTFDSTLEYAMALGMTNDGEMFCAYNLAYVAETYNKVKLEVKDISVENTNDTCSTVVDIFTSVCGGRPVLIPYDRNHYFAPSKSEGKFAHWAVIIGVILPPNYKDLFNVVEDCCKDELGTGGYLEMYEIISSLRVAADNVLDSLENDLLLVCVHGMSEKPFVCSYKSIVSSNQQMTSSKTKFYLASEGLKHLRNKIVFISQ